MNNGKMDVWERIHKGVRDGKRAFCGPHTVQIDLTDKCNNSCLACWVHSPLLDKKEIFPQGEKELPYKLVEQLIHQLHRMGVKEITLAGSGEPFMYPDIRKVIQLVKGLGIYLNIITNGMFLNEETAGLLIKQGVDLITASIWAGTPEVYLETHPGRDVRDFEILRQNFKTISHHKRQAKSAFPIVKTYNVLCSKNCDDLGDMISFAKEIDADFLEFQIVDVIKGKTDHLVLDGTLQKKLIENFDRAARREDLVKWKMMNDSDVQGDGRPEPFGKIWKNFRSDFVLLDNALNIVCQEGRLCKKGESPAVVLPPGGSHNLNFRFFFDPGECSVCRHYKQCFPSNDCAVDVRFLAPLGVETLMRRISSPEAELGVYEKQIDFSPCYIGWYYARILTSGDVIPCCKSYLHPLGNLYKKPFNKIWNSMAYKKFRSKAKRSPKTDPYFSRINCIKSCDNWGMNMKIHEKIRAFSADKAQGPVEPKTEIIIPAKDFMKGNFNAGHHDFGKDLIIDGGEKKGFAYYTFSVDEDGAYEIWSRYTSEQARPVDIYLNKTLVKKGALTGTTGGWTPRHLRWFKELTIELKKDNYLFEIRSSNMIPHIEKFILFRKGKSPEFIKKEEKDASSGSFSKRLRNKKFTDILRKVSDYFTARGLRERYLDMLGIYDREYGYKGPFHVQIDLTNNCNNNCIACWCNSPLLKEKRLSAEEKQQYLPLELVKELLDEAVSLGAREVYYSGSGEPFTHPHIMEVLEYTKKKNLICHVNTNFTLLDEQKIDRLIETGVDFLTVSTWTAAAETYEKTHPNRTKEDFLQIKDNLLYLNTHKTGKPCIKLYNVLFNMNYFEVEKMVEFAAETKSESLEFTLVDTIPDATDSLALNKKQVSELKEALTRIKSRLDNKNMVKDTNVLVFQFDQFLRRVYIEDDVREAKYDRNIIDSIPCYIGWLFARVIPNGQVHSCLKAHRIPTGSLYKQRFSEIWNSRQQALFRKKTLVWKKDDPFFRMIGNDCNIKEAGCYKSCDDIGRNSWMHDRMLALTVPEKLLLNCTANVLKAARKIRRKKGSYKKYHDERLMAGICHGRKAYIGPEQVVIDPTNKCNLRCVSCWLYSPFLEADKPGADLLKQELPKNTLLRLIDDLSSMGTKRIRFTGGGEPFMHKDLVEVIEYARKKQLLVAITTNLGLAAQDDIKRLLELGLEELCISIWAANPLTYTAVHQDVYPSYFEKIKDNLRCLKQLKKGKPRVTFANVIMNSNFNDFKDMYEMGLQYGADAVYFTLADVFEGQTDRLILNEEQRKTVLSIAMEIKERNKKDNIKLEFFDGFMRRISQPAEVFAKGEYDRCDIDKIPCYAGWIFSRILADGSVVPCCRGVKKVMGNINSLSFKDIWSSEAYDEFRAKAKYLSKTNAYFEEIGCVKECDNLMHNEQMHSKICASK